MNNRIIRVRKLGAEEVRWETSHSFWDVGMALDAENQLERTENQHTDSGEDWNTRRIYPVMHRAQTEHCRAWGPATAQKNI